ncbi:F-box/LRR-repeat protein 14 [Mauremys reevesii]|uniref:F-box/LRR-repeat protein 14 n=1 Tax=Mauremys reevesii TaxID=260615 RepID=UPI00193EEA5B|nr:F-box/LRR-repeat protein 14 [Mauremys reevesii]
MGRAVSRVTARSVPDRTIVRGGGRRRLQPSPDPAQRRLLLSPSPRPERGAWAQRRAQRGGAKQADPVGGSAGPGPRAAGSVAAARPLLPPRGAAGGPGLRGSETKEAAGLGAGTRDREEPPGAPARGRRHNAARGGPPAPAAAARGPQRGPPGAGIEAAAGAPEPGRAPPASSVPPACHTGRRCEGPGAGSSHSRAAGTQRKRQLAGPGGAEQRGSGGRGSRPGPEEPSSEDPAGAAAGPGCAMETHISCLFPELLAMIFGYLEVRDKGRAAQVCTAWRDAAYHRSVWRGVEAKLHLRRANPSLFPSLAARGIRRVQILSLRRSLSYVIQGMAEIESLNLSGCYNLTDNGLGHAFVAEIGSLRALNLSLCKQITDSSLGRIAQYLKGLEVLELGGCSNITNTGLLLIAWGLQRLKSLNLRSCRHLSDVGIGHLAGMTRSAAEGCLGLEQLTLQDCQKLSDLSLKHLARGLGRLRQLNLSFCGGISDAGLLHLSHMSSLRSLNLRSCDNISDTGIMHLAMGSLRLSGLDVSFCDKVGDQSLAYIAQGLDGLRSLSLCSCHISDEGINRMVRQMHGLRTLNIGQCVRITDKGLELIAEHLSQLTGIDLYGCTRITKRGLERITQLPCLKVLNLGLWQMTESEKVR